MDGTSAPGDAAAETSVEVSATDVVNKNDALRQRRGIVKKRKSTRTHLSFHVDEPRSDKLTEAQQRVFLNMYMRKAQRRVRGKQKNDNLFCEFVVVLLLIAAIIVLGWDDDDETNEEWGKGDTVGLVGVVIWVLVILAVFFIFEDSVYAKMLRWMVVYIPLVAFVAALSFYEEVAQNPTSTTRVLGINIPNDDYHLIIFILFIIAEVITFTSFTLFYKFFPWFLKSKWVQKNPGRAANFWRVGVVQDWTMSYTGHNPHGTGGCNLNHTCMYEGQTDPDTGLPDGLGRWLDDAWEGETLTGYWKQGVPVAPFSSWNVSNDDAIVAVRVAYYKATDDEYEKNKLVATNDQYPPECGIASVECSVSGSFYKHLPCATLIEGPYLTENMPTDQNNPIRECLSHLFQAQQVDEEKDGFSSISIQATDARGIQVVGHVYEPTGRYYSPDVKNITVEVDWGSEKSNRTDENTDPPAMGGEIKRASARFLQKTLFMPKAAPTPLARVVQVEVEDSSDEEEDVEGGESNTDIDRKFQPQSSENPLRDTTAATLRVKDWAPVAYKEALIFFPGYNFTMKSALQTFGQFLAMTKLSRHVYPFVFVWPASYNVGYFYASSAAATDTTQLNLLKLIKGLKVAGISRVNFMTHSMGAQTLLSAFRDKYDENGEFVRRSDVSMSFQLDPEFDDSPGPVEGKRQQFSNQMVCKSVILLNPCFPVEPFVDRAFLSIRRVCQTVTLIGDRNDRALRWSARFNMCAPHVPCLKYELPEAMRSSIVHPCQQKKWEPVKRIGTSIDELYFSDDDAQRYYSKGGDKEFRRLVFNKGAHINVRGGQTIKDQDRFWLDMDVIDMTGLDTNIKGMRHNGFGLNAMLLKDLEELLSSGKRAMKRSSLLYREGNIFSYAHAPAFVAN